MLLRAIPANDYVNITWKDKIYITWSCDASYSYACLLLFCLPFMVIVVIVLICSDIMMPCLSRCRCQNSDSNVTAILSSQPRFDVVGKYFLLSCGFYLCMLLLSLVSVCIVLTGLTLVLMVINFISKAPGIFDGKVKVCLLALSTIFFCGVYSMQQAQAVDTK